MRFILIFCSLICISTHAQTRKYSFSQPKMGSPFIILLYASDSAKAAQTASKAYQLVDSLNVIYSDYLPNSELSLLSKTAGDNQFHSVSPAMEDILKKSVSASEKSDGAYDITVGQLVKLWRKARKEKQFPELKSLTIARQNAGFHQIILDTINHRVKINKPEILLDLGGIAKGYIAQKVVDFVKNSGIQSVLADAGGDLATGTAPPGKTGWSVGVNVPNSEELMQKLVFLQNKAIATSGDMYQYLELNGKRYSHIIDPKTGLGLTHQRNVTVIAPDGATADWLATACSILPVKKSLKLIRSVRGCELLIAEIRDGKILKWQSEGFGSYLNPEN